MWLPCAGNVHHSRWRSTVQTMGLWQPRQMRILSSRQEPRSGSAHTSKTTTCRIRRDQFTPCWRYSLTVVRRIPWPRRLQTDCVIAPTLPNLQRLVLEGSFGVALMRNAPTWNGPLVVRCNLDPMQWNPRVSSALQGGPATLMFASRCVVIEKVVHRHWTHNRCSAIRPVTGRQVIAPTRTC